MTHSPCASALRSTENYTLHGPKQHLWPQRDQPRNKQNPRKDFRSKLLKIIETEYNALPWQHWCWKLCLENFVFNNYGKDILELWTLLDTSQSHNYSVTTGSLGGFLTKKLGFPLFFPSISKKWFSNMKFTLPHSCEFLCCERKEIKERVNNTKPKKLIQLWCQWLKQPRLLTAHTQTALDS